MALLTFPLPPTDFARILRATRVRFFLDEDQDVSNLAKGQLIVADLAPRYWNAEVRLINMERRDAMRIQALIESLDGGLNDFYLYDPRCEFPLRDPDGSELGAATVTNIAVAANGKQMRFDGKPGYIYSPGDMFSFNYGPGNAYRALHRLVDGDTANGSGETGLMEFRPHLADPDLATGKEMTIIRAAARMKLLPGTVDYGEGQQTMTTNMSFKCRQVP